MPTPSTPRITPLPAEGRDEEISALLAKVNGPDGGDNRLMATVARHRKLLAKWSPLAFNLMLRGAIEPRDREILILRAAWVNNCEYEWGQHAQIATRCGLSAEEIVALSGPRPGEVLGEWGQVLVDAVDELARDRVISTRTWERLAARFDDRQLIEVPFMVGHYTMLAYAMNSIGIEPEDGVPGFV